MDILDRKRHLSLLGWLLHAAGVLSLLFGGLTSYAAVSFFFSRPESQNEDEIARLEECLVRATETRREYRVLQDELAELERNAEIMRQRIPDQPRHEEFLRELDRSAKAARLSVLNYEQMQGALRDTHSEFDVQLACEGDYTSICSFLDQLANLPRVAVIHRMHIAPRSELPRYPINMTLTLYYGAGKPRDNG